MEKLLKIFPHKKPDLWPIIKSGSFHMLVIQRKSEWFNQMKECSCTDTCTPDIAGIPVNFRRNEHHMPFPGGVFGEFKSLFGIFLSGFIKIHSVSIYPRY